METTKKIKELSFLSIVIFYLSLVFFSAEGTQNYLAWVYYLDLANAFGITDGYAYRVDTYPPFSHLILKLFYNFFSLLGLEVFSIIKISMIFFLYTSSLIIYFYSKSLKIAIFFIFSYVVCTLGSIDLDIFYGLFLILAFIALKKEKIILFSIFYCISILMKWQPIILAPFLMIYIAEVNIKSFSIKSFIDAFKSLNFQNLLKSFLVVLIFVLICFVTYGFLPIVKSFYVSLNHNYLSGNALNFNWFITWLLQLVEGRSYEGRILFTKIYSHYPNYVYLGTVIFFLIYFSILLIFSFKKRRNIEDLYFFCALAFFAVFIFNKGAHSNHLFGATLLFILLFIENRKWIFHAITTVMISNANIIMFYGINGSGKRLGVINNSFDLTLILTILNVFYFLYLLYLVRVTIIKKN